MNTMDNKQQFSIWYVLIAVVFLLSLQNVFGGHTETLAYCDFRTLLAANKLKPQWDILEQPTPTWLVLTTSVVTIIDWPAAHGAAGNAAQRGSIT